MGFRHPVVIINLINLFSFTFFLLLLRDNVMVELGNSLSQKNITRRKCWHTSRTHTVYFTQHAYTLGFMMLFLTDKNDIFIWLIHKNSYTTTFKVISFMIAKKHQRNTNIICQRISQCLLIFNVQKWKWGIIKEQ